MKEYVTVHMSIADAIDGEVVFHTENISVPRQWLRMGETTYVRAITHNMNNRFHVTLTEVETNP